MQRPTQAQLYYSIYINDDSFGKKKKKNIKRESFLFLFIYLFFFFVVSGLYNTLGALIWA